MPSVSLKKKPIAELRGAYLFNVQTLGNASRASLSYNMRYPVAGPITRNGYSLLLAANTLGTFPILMFYNWVATFESIQYSRIIYYANGQLWVFFFGFSIGTNPASLYTLACAGFCAVEAETRLYLGHYDTNGFPIGNCKIINYILGTTPAFDAFPDPPTPTSFTATDGGTGLVTAGQHNFCFRVETQSGFEGRVSATIATYTASGSAVATVSITMTNPVDALIVHLGMTTTDNLFQYFEVAQQGVTPGVTGTIVFTVNYPDDVLVTLTSSETTSGSAEMTDFFNLLTLSNGAPRPAMVLAFGNRNVYIDGATAYVSDPYKLQWLLNPQNLIQVEGQRWIQTAAVLGSVLVLCGANWTYVWAADNVTIPSALAPPSSASESIGTQCINGIIPTSNNTYLLVAHESGLYPFNGTYPAIPLSFTFDSDWKRINWPAARSVLTMVDDPRKRCIYVNVPLDGAPACNYRMVLDYSRAVPTGPLTTGIPDPLAIDYTLDDLLSASSVSSIGKIQNFTTKVNEVCLGLPDGNIVREDPTSFIDRTGPIHSLYETGLILLDRERTLELSRFGGMQPQVYGNGNLQITPYGLGRKNTSDDPVIPMQLQTAPNGDGEAEWHMVSENQSIRMECGTSVPGEWFQITRLTAFYKPAGITKTD